MEIKVVIVIIAIWLSSALAISEKRVVMALRCKLFGHEWKLKQRSNVIQFDDMGYPLRLFICECKYCLKSEQMWIDSTECKNDVVLQWYDEDYIPIPLKGRK